MVEPRPITGPVRLPADPKEVADRQVHGLSSLGNLHRPPTEREYEHAALDVALAGTDEAAVFAVLGHLDTVALNNLGLAAHWLESACDQTLESRLGPRP